MKLRRDVVLGLALAALLIGFAASAGAASSPAEEGVQPVAAAAAETTSVAPLVFESPGKAPTCQHPASNLSQVFLSDLGLGDLQSMQEPILLDGTCSGDVCGCYDPPCNEECEVGDMACMSSCRQEQKQCAICCCCCDCQWWC